MSIDKYSFAIPCIRSTAILFTRSTSLFKGQSSADSQIIAEKNNLIYILKKKDLTVIFEWLQEELVRKTKRN
jgi:hypothetical protein